MFPSVHGLLMAALCAAGVSPGDDLARLSIRVPAEVVEQAMPTPPDKVVLKTSYYGTVTVDHTAHLARKARCRDCHGPGPVTAIEFTPKLAHDRCRGCHTEIKKGPTDCKGCHVLPPEGPSTLATAAAPAAAATAAAGGAAAPQAKVVPGGQAAAGTSGDVAGFHTIVAQPVGPIDGLAPGAAAGAPVAAVVASAELTEPEPDPNQLRRAIQLGAAGGDGFGFSARISSRQGRVFLTQGFDRLSGQDSTRTTVLLGAGAQLPVPLPRTLQWVAEGVVGVDAVEKPLVHVMAALGGRVGLEWTPVWAQGFSGLFSVTGLMDLGQGSLMSPATLYATLVVGAPLQRR